MTEEVWIEIPRCPGHFASNLGNIKGPSGRVLKPNISPKGYRRFGVVEDGVRTCRVGSRLVARAFIDDIPDLMVRHINGIPNDDRPENLAYGDAKQNYADAVNHGTNSKGEIHGNSILTESQVREIRQRYIPGKLGYNKLGKAYGVDRHTIKLIVKNINWRHI